MKYKKILKYLFLIIAILFLSYFEENWANFEEKIFIEKNEKTPLFKQYNFIKVVDWDTIKVSDILTNKKYFVRMLWIDSPENTKKRFWYIECYWKEAKKYLEKLIWENKKLFIEKDLSQWEFDKYWRILWYIYKDKNWENLNLKMIKDWFAFEFTFNLPYLYQKSFKNAQKNSYKKWIWLFDKKTCNWKRIKK